ncbi:MAG: hypothetical protein CEN91_299, partial [Candidatus Berkelbacteria bacterium Licking1014_85]
FCSLASKNGLGGLVQVKGSTLLAFLEDGDEASTTAIVAAIEKAATTTAVAAPPTLPSPPPPAPVDRVLFVFSKDKGDKAKEAMLKKAVALVAEEQRKHHGLPESSKGYLGLIVTITIKALLTPQKGKEWRTDKVLHSELSAWVGKAVASLRVSQAELDAREVVRVAFGEYRRLPAGTWKGLLSAVPEYETAEEVAELLVAGYYGPTDPVKNGAATAGGDIADFGEATPAEVAEHNAAAEAAGKATVAEAAILDFG